MGKFFQWLCKKMVCRRMGPIMHRKLSNDLDSAKEGAAWRDALAHHGRVFWATGKRNWCTSRPDQSRRTLEIPM